MTRSGGERGGDENGRMQIREVSIADESIRLGQFLKLAGLAEDGGQAKMLIESEDVTVNGRVEVRRGRQLGGGDVVAVGAERVRLVSGA
jgi:ribosome-associated protein